jgi:hypothetical protein
MVGQARQLYESYKKNYWTVMATFLGYMALIVRFAEPISSDIYWGQTASGLISEWVL